MSAILPSDSCGQLKNSSIIVQPKIVRIDTSAIEFFNFSLMLFYRFPGLMKSGECDRKNVSYFTSRRFPSYVLI